MPNDAADLDRPRSDLAHVAPTATCACSTSQPGGRRRFSPRFLESRVLMPQINGGQALIRSLEMEGVEVIFGLPGGAILPVYDPIIDSPIRHILVRHEQGAGHMAEGFAHATGRPGVAMVT